ncbi:MAG: sodium:solute symporter family transporter, partial [Planctomycetota bacterium]
LFGAVMSSLDSMLNSASTIFTMDFYKGHVNKAASPRQLLRIGRTMTAVFVVIACLWAPVLSHVEGVFDYIQKFWGFLSPGIVTVFVFGMLWPRVPATAANGAMLLGIPVYGLLLWLLPDVAFLHHMAITFLVLGAFLTVVTLTSPLREPNPLPESPDFDMAAHPGVKWMGGVIVVLTAVLYILFW